MKRFSRFPLLMLGAIIPLTSCDQEGKANASVLAATETEFTSAIKTLEQRHGGRIGVATLDTGNHFGLTYRGAERFAMCSTFKLPLAMAVAARVDAGKESWDRKIKYTRKDILSYAPVTGKPENLESGEMTVAALCAAAMELSDNTAANLLLATIGGPEGLTGHLRSIGDKVTRLDRIEPDLNTNLTGDDRDTTTPEAMIATMNTVLLGDALSPDSRKRLIDWLVANQTGDKRLRAGMPPGWRTGDKTGTGENGATNDVAIVWPGEGKPPLLIAVYHTDSTANPEQREQLIAETGKMAVKAHVSLSNGRN